MALSEARKRANAKSDAKNAVRVMLKFNKNTDVDILEKLGEVGNKTGYIKELIRNDIKKDRP